MQLKVGELVEGKVTSIKDYGVFVELDEGKSGMVHISEISRTYVNDIHEHLSEGQTVKMKVMTIGDDGKISLSIKRAMEPEGDSSERKKGNFRKSASNYKPDNSYTWTPKKQEPTSFEEMMNQFKATSDEKFSDLKRKNPETKRSKRGANVR